MQGAEERPQIADTRIKIVILRYMLRWKRREESKNPTQLSQANAPICACMHLQLRALCGELFDG
jgi:hypothetical protein